MVVFVMKPLLVVAVLFPAAAFAFIAFNGVPYRLEIEAMWGCTGCDIEGYVYWKGGYTIGPLRSGRVDLEAKHTFNFKVTFSDVQDLHANKMSTMIDHVVIRQRDAGPMWPIKQIRLFEPYSGWLIPVNRFLCGKDADWNDILVATGSPRCDEINITTSAGQWYETQHPGTAGLYWYLRK